MRKIKLTDYITLVILGYEMWGKDHNKYCYLEFTNGETYPII